MLAQIPAAVERFANLDDPRTRRAYQNDLEEFCGFVNLASADEFRVVTRSHVLAWRAPTRASRFGGSDDPAQIGSAGQPFDHLLESNAIAGGNPVHRVKRPRIESNAGKTPALGDHQAKAMLEAPD